MLYAKVNANDEIVRAPVDFTDLTMDEVQQGVRLLPYIIKVDPPHDPVLQKVVRSVVVVASRVEQMVQVVDKVAEEIAVTLPVEKSNALSRLADIRYQKEVGGIVIAGTRYATDRESRSVIATSLMTLADDESVDWKTDSGWVPVTKADLTIVSSFLKEHVKACFAREKALFEAIEAATTIAELRAIDLEVGWPSNN